MTVRRLPLAAKMIRDGNPDRSGAGYYAT